MHPPFYGSYTTGGSSLDSREQIYTVVFDDACQLLRAIEYELAKRPKESNIIYAHAYKLSLLKRARHAIAPNQFWIACYSRRKVNDANCDGDSISFSALDFVLSCTEGLLGAYPIFIYSNHPATQCTPSFLEPRMSALAERLYDTVHPTRIFSIFSLTAITRCFATVWTELTGIRVVQGEPWYSATSSFCNKDTFRGARTVSDPEHVMRQATIADLDGCATLCQEFAATSPPFTLSRDQARKEAEYLIQNNQLWIYEVPAHPPSSSLPANTSTGSVGTRARAISTIVAVTRTTPTVSAITKVFTTAAYRKRGCADRLVAHVTGVLLERNVNHSVVLYVGHTLDAVRVYDRVGFVGLDRSSGKAVESVEDWLELGFEGAQLGHW